MIKVTVIIPVYNQEELILRALDSIPDRNDVEVIVVDDGSTDKTFWAVGLYERRKVNLIGLSKNQGLSKARNEALRFASGEYVVMLDSDDYFYTDEFNKCIELLDGKDMVYYNLQVNSGEVWRLTPETKNNLVGCTKFIRRQFLGSTRYDENVKLGEDLQFYYDLQAKNPTEKFSDLTVYHYDYPREGSLYDLLIKEKKNGEEFKGICD